MPDFGDLAPPDFWATVSALQAHLFPPLPGTPSIADVNATAYFSAVLLDARIDGEERAFLAHGVGLLDAYVRRRFGRPFDALEESEREAALRAVEQSPTGQLWLSRMIYYVLEALLGDPIYGGNPGGVGWRWLEHEPGFPQPVRGWHGGAPADA